MSDEKKVKVEVPAKFKDLVEQIEKLSVLDLAELVKVLEEKFGVTAAAPVAMAMAPAAGAVGAADAEEKTSFTVELTVAGDQKINVIKALREVTALSLKEAKDMADAAPQVVKEGATKEEAEKIKAALTTAGATVTLK
jgi:large subunit ribosomal protein L7/L12